MPTDPSELFSLKEWMAAISAKLDRLEQKLDTKADIQHVQSIDMRVGMLEKQHVEGKAERDYLVPQHNRMLEAVGRLETKTATIGAVEQYKRWVWGTAAAAFVSSVVSIVAMFGRF